ncbi:MAG: right-handed parallel beta-helix repeat-containing protein [Pseudomonadota bacterium]
MKSMKRAAFLSFFILTVVLSVTQAEATNVSGAISSSTTWTLAGSPYVVTGDITLSAGVTLTIQPGVVVQFGDNVALWVDGTLSAVGTSSAHITFTGTSESPDWWRVISIQNAGSATFEWCDIAYGGYYENADILKTGTGSLSLKNSTIRYSDGDGFRIAEGYSTFTSAGNTFSNNNYGVRLGINTSFDDNTSVFSANNLDVYVDGGTITRDVIWNLKKDYSFYISGDIGVNAGVTLTIKPGTVIKPGDNVGFWISGTLTAAGTSTSPIYFTDWRDDTVGGDANHDGNASGPASDWWRAIFIQGDGSAWIGSALEWCTLRYAGFYENRGLYKTGGSDLSLSNCTVSNSDGDGMVIENNTGDVALSQSTFTNNGWSGLSLSTGPATATGCTFSNNGHYGVRQGINDSIVYTSNTFNGNTLGGVGVNGGTMTTPITLQAAGNPFNLIGDIGVASGVTLTLEPGTEVQFSDNVGLWVDGTLTAVGTSANPITVTGTSESSDWWRVISVQNAGSAVFEWCDIAYGGYYENADILKTGTGALSLKNSSIRHSDGDGLRISAGYSAFTSSGNTFSNNNYGVRLGINTSFDDNTSVFSANNLDVYVDGGTIDQNVIWNLKPAYSLYISGNITVTGVLTVKPGTVVKPGDNVGIWVSGALNAVGTSTSPIYFTDWRDDTVGGDANHDGTASAPASDWWRALFFNGGSSSGTLAWCTLRYAGYYENLGLYKSGSGALTLSDCTVSDSDGYGMIIENNTGVVTLSRSSFTNNAWSGLYMSAGPATATDCTFSNNGHYGIRQEINDSLVYTGNTFTGNSLGGVGVNGGTITTDITWQASGSPINLAGDIGVASGASLTIEPGTEVQFSDNVGLWIDGTLTAVGTSSNPITFTGTTESPDWWRVISVQNAGSAVFEWCDIAYGGYYENANILKTGTGSLSLKNSTIRHCDGDGLRIAAGSSTFTSSGNSFSNNNYGVRLGINTSFDDNTSGFSANNLDVFVDGGTITTDVIWNLKANYSLYISDNIGVGTGAILTIKPGTVVKPGDNVGFWVSGTLSAVGSSAAPIYFTDWRDDTVGGDANGDESATAAASDWWRAVFIQEEGTAILTWCTLRYAGYYENVGLYKTGSGDLDLTRCTISDSDGNGLQITGSTGDHSISRNTFTLNATGVYILNQAEPIAMDGNRIEANTSWGIYSQGSAEVDARDNWWGDASGPWHATLNPEGQGDTVSDGVLFDPWATSPSTVEILAPMRSGTLLQGDSLRFMGTPLEDANATYSWEFGEGRTSSDCNPGLVIFSSAGDHTVQFQAQIEGEANSSSDTRMFTVVTDTGAYPDLQVTSVTIPDSLVAGQPASIAYTARNAGDGAITGTSWKDALYFSDDPYLDASDQPLGTINVESTVSAGASYQNAIDITLPVVEEGAQYLLLSLNDEWRFVERHRLNNEHASAVTVSIPNLVNDEGHAGNHGIGRVEQYYRMTAAGGQNLVLSFDADSSGLEVYVRYGGLPTRGTYDYRLTDKDLSIPGATAGQWYVLIYGNMSQSGQYTIEYSMTDLALSAVSPNRHTTLADAELTLSGAGFISPLSVALVSGGGSSYSADSVELDSVSQAVALFSAGSVPAGTYAVRISYGGKSDELASAVEIVAGGTAKLETRLILPSAFGYHQLATVYVEYSNTGNAPMAAPLLLVTATQNNTAGAIMTLDATRLSSGFWTSAMPEGFSNSVQFIASGETPGILQPGESGRVPVYYAGWQQPWDFAYPPFEWNVGVLDADNTTPVSWSEMKDGMRPSYVRSDAWDVVWNNFITQAGVTWGDYVSMLSKNALYLNRMGQRVDDIAPLLSLAFREADGLSPLPTLATGVDAAIEAPGLSIVFERSYAQPISRRFELGPLGRGWAHNWQYALSVSEDGTIVITDMTGTPRIFQPDSRYANRYLAQPGDQGDLRASGGAYTLSEPNGSVRAFGADGKLNYIEDTNGNRITCAYSGSKLTGLTHSSGLSLTIAYNGSGFISAVTDHIGRQTLYTYTGEHLTSFQTYDGRTTTYTYNDSAGSAGLHALSKIGLPDGTQRFFTYDELGRLATTYRDSDAEKTTFSHADGRVDATDAMSHTSRFFFDHVGRMVKGENALGEAVQLSFDELGNLTAVTDPAGISSTFSYDRKGNLIEISDAMRHKTQLTYTRSYNRLASVTDANSNRTVYDYDAKGNLTSTSYPDGSEESWGYDATGNPTAWTNRRQNPIHYIRDTQGRITGKTYADASLATYTYDNRGNLATAVNEQGTTAFTYNNTDLLTRIDYPGGRYLIFTYDGVGRRKSSQDQMGYRVTYEYGDAGRLIRLADGSDQTLVEYDYNELGHLAQKTMGNGVHAVYAYDAANRLLSLVNHKPGGEELSRFVYTYDRRGRRSSMTTHYGVWTYSYDDLGQLTRAILTSTDPAIADQDLTYEYDPLGNRERTVENGQSKTYDVNTLNQFASVGDRTYTYDLDGNLIQETGPDGTTTYSYNDENRLIGVTRDGDSWQYAYDALGNRVAVDENGATTHYVVDPAGLGETVGEYGAGGSLIARYTYGLGLLNRMVSSATAATADYYTFDPMGNTSELTGTAGVLRNAYAYQPFGKALLENESRSNPFRFVGEFGGMADASGLHYMRARHYDPQTGRFSTKDPIGLFGGDVNLYRYAMNTPVSMIDPLGLSCGQTSGKRKFAESWTRYHDHIDMRNAPRHPSGNLDEDAWVNQYTQNRSNLHRDSQGLAVDIVNDQIVDSFWSWIPFYDWFSGASDIDEVKNGIEDARNPKFCGWSKKPPATPTPPTGAGANGASGGAGSQDPNEKLTISGYGAPNYVAGGTLVSYHVDFENMASATAPAQFVTVRDKLSSNLDVSTIELLEAGFGNVIIPIPPGQQYLNEVVDYDYVDDDYNFKIKVRVEVWIEDGRVNANFSSIDPESEDAELPPAVNIGFLMPENNTGRGKGHISFAVKPKDNLASGTAIRNVATIQFDGGLVIDTNQVNPLDANEGTDPAKEALITVDTATPTSAVSPLPDLVQATFVVLWSGQDNDAGIAGYDIWVQEKDGPWTLWKSNIMETSAEFSGIIGNNYYFYSVAADYAGNREAAPAQADTDTLVEAGPLTAKQFIEGIYVAYWGRAADPGGLNYWLGLYNDGTLDYAGIAENFAPSPEGTGAYAYFDTVFNHPENPITDEMRQEFVEAIYQNLFDRDSDAEGLAYWVGILKSGAVSPGEFIATIINSAYEGRQGASADDWDNINAKIQVAEYYTDEIVEAGFTWTVEDNLQQAADVLVGVNKDSDIVAAKQYVDERILSNPN